MENQTDPNENNKLNTPLKSNKENNNLKSKQLSDYNRNDLIFLARLYDKAEKYEDMVKYINYFIKLNPVLNIEERNLLSSGYKNVLSSRRFSWRYLQNQLKKEEKENHSLAANYVLEIKKKVEAEISKICIEINEIIDSLLLPNAEDVEFKVYYLKMKGDYYRYQCEVSSGGESFSSNCQNAENAYKAAHEYAEDSLPISSITRLGTALNYSVFLFEIKEIREEATNIAKSALDEGLKVLDELEKNMQKDTILIIQLLMENLMLWNADNQNEET